MEAWDAKAPFPTSLVSASVTWVSSRPRGTGANAGLGLWFPVCSHLVLLAIAFSAGSSHTQFGCVVWCPGTWTGAPVTTHPAPWKAAPSGAISSLHCVKGVPGGVVFRNVKSAVRTCCPPYFRRNCIYHVSPCPVFEEHRERKKKTRRDLTQLVAGKACTVCVRGWTCSRHLLPSQPPLVAGSL